MWIFTLLMYSHACRLGWFRTHTRGGYYSFLFCSLFLRNPRETLFSPLFQKNCCFGKNPGLVHVLTLSSKYLLLLAHLLDNFPPRHRARETECCKGGFKGIFLPAAGMEEGGGFMEKERRGGFKAGRGHLNAKWENEAREFLRGKKKKNWIRFASSSFLLR